MDVITIWTGARASALRQAHRMSAEEFAAVLGMGVRTVAGWSPESDAILTPVSQASLDTMLRDAPADVQRRFQLILEERDGLSPGSSACLSAEPVEVNCHRFMPVYVGADAVKTLMADLATTRACEWTAYNHVSISHPTDTCDLYGFPWGVLLYHVEESVSASSLAQLAIQRRESRLRDLAWTKKHGEEIGYGNGAEYALTAFWVNGGPWDHVTAQTAMKILSVPRVLLDQSGEDATVEQVEAVERQLLTTQFDDGEIVSFGTPGVSYGYASWAGVSYFPLSSYNAIDKSYFIELEATAQALWSYCHHLRRLVEDAKHVETETEYGWQWLRAMKSRLVAPRPTESRQMVAMRSAILKTSRLDAHLSELVDIIHGDERRATG